MFPPHGGSHQPSWQPGHGHGQRHSGPPPQKRARNGPGPVITRYPPPPGYKGPGQPGGPFQQQQGWQQPNYGHSQPSCPGYQQPTYGQTPPYQQQTYPGMHRGTTQSYHPAAYNQQSSYPPTTQAWQTGSTWQTHQPQPPPRQGPTPPWQQQTSYNPQPWQAGPPVSQVPWQRQNSSESQPRQNSAPFPMTAQNAFDDFSPQPPEPTHVSNEAEELEGNYWDECYFAGRPNEIEEHLSLGEIVYRPALPTRRPLPATFDLAEVEALAPRVPLPTDEESISDYHIQSRQHEHLLDIRQTDMWEYVKNDPVFREFAPNTIDLVHIRKLRTLWADRQNASWATTIGSPTPDPQSERFQREDTADTEGGAADMELESVESDSHPTEQADILGSLERAPSRNHTSGTGYRSRTNSVTSNTSQTRPQPMGLIRDQAQEDLLARLGVTGSPKMVYGLPPAVVPPSGKSASNDTSHARKPSHPTNNGRAHSRANSSAQGRPVPPPPPPPPGLPPYPNPAQRSSWNDFSNGHVRTASSGSQHTATGSDFYEEDPFPVPADASHSNGNRSVGGGANDATPRPSGKRGYGYFDEDGEDEETPKARKKQARGS